MMAHMCKPRENQERIKHASKVATVASWRFSSSIHTSATRSRPPIILHCSVHFHFLMKIASNWAVYFESFLDIVAPAPSVDNIFPHKHHTSLETTWFL